MSESVETCCVQGGYQPKNGEPREVPIVQSTTFAYENSSQMGDLFDLKASGYFYSRLQNPTLDSVAAKICELEGGSAAMLTASGMAAAFFSIFGETIANPALVVLDIERWAKAAHAHGGPLIVDNTFATPVNCRPIEWGADIVIHSTTKYMDGHGAAVGGAIVDGGTFDWMAHKDKFPGLTEPDPSYHGLVYAQAFGQGGAYITKATVQLMRDLGAIQSPQNAFYLNLGLESLHVRMAQHCKNGQAVAEALAANERVEWVRYPGLPTDPYFELGKKYLPQGSCGVVSVGIAGGREAAEKFLGNLKIFRIETHVADARSCALHPASSTHRQLSDEELIGAGITPNTVRLSCGIEGTQDLVADVEQALAAL